MGSALIRKRLDLHSTTLGFQCARTMARQRRNNGDNQHNASLLSAFHVAGCFELSAETRARLDAAAASVTVNPELGL